MPLILYLYVHGCAILHSLEVVPRCCDESATFRDGTSSL